MPWMNHFTSSGLDQPLIEMSLRAALILAVSWLAAIVAERLRSSAAARHLIWSLGLLGALVLPLLSATLPAWKVVVERHEIRAGRLTGLEPQSVKPGQEAMLIAWGTAAPGIGAKGSEVLGDKAHSDGEIVSANDSRPLEARDAILPGEDWLPFTGVTWMFVVWAVGAMVLLLPTVVGLASLWSLSLRSKTVTCGPLVEKLAQVKARLGYRGHVRLLQSHERAMPMTWGIWSPAILLPDGAEHWSPERLSVVLLHELAHVQRRDCLTQHIAQVSRAMYWFNPLAWLAEQQIRGLQEQACDDVVLSQGHAAPDYAEHLLDVSKSCFMKQRAGAVALAMAPARSMERRIMSILNVKQNRQPLGIALRGGLGLAAAALLISIAVLRVEEVTADEAGQAGGQPAAASNQSAERAKELAELREKIAEQYVTPVDDKEIAEGAIKGMLGALRDPHSDFLTPEMLASMERSLAGAIVGIGVQLEREQEQLRVVTALQDSPALAAGIQPGDVILEIDGKPAAGITLTEAVKLIAGAQGSVVRLQIGRAGDQQTQIEVTRGPVKLPTVRGFRRGANQRWDFMLGGSEKIGYAQVTMFGSATPEELRAALAQMQQQGVKGLILDLRFCPGGSLDAAVNSAKLFLDSGTIVSLHGREGTAKTIKADGADVLRGAPMVVLVSGHTASSGEVVAGALQDNRRAVVLGTRTVGKGTVQSLIQLTKGDGAIKLTTARYQLPSGRNIDKQPASKSWGIDPDEGYFVPVDRAQMKTLLTRVGRDVIGGKGQASENAPVTAQWIEEVQGDPQLAAALKTLTARLQTGTFAKVSSLSQTQIEQFLTREDIEQRREVARESLEKLDRELAGLEKAAK